jgi:hypothetical protein
MSEPLESALAGVGVDAPHQVDFPLGDVRHHPEAPGDLHLGQAAAAPTYGEVQVASEAVNSEFEAGGGEALQPPAPSCPQTAPTATADGVVGVHLQQVMSLIAILHYLTKAKMSQRTTKSPARKTTALRSLQLQAVPPP